MEIGSRGGAETRRSEGVFSRRGAKTQRCCVRPQALLSKQHSDLREGLKDKAAAPHQQPLCAFAPLREQSLPYLLFSASPRLRVNNLFGVSR